MFLLISIVLVKKINHKIVAKQYFSKTNRETTIIHICLVAIMPAALGNLEGSATYHFGSIW